MPWRLLWDQQGGRARDLHYWASETYLVIPANTNVNAITAAAAVATNGQHAMLNCPHEDEYIQVKGARSHHPTHLVVAAQAQHVGVGININAANSHQAPPLQNTMLSFHTYPGVLPPTYGLHAVLPIPASHLITPFTSIITSLSSYLADPLNAYMHFRIPKYYVYLVGPVGCCCVGCAASGGRL